MPLAQAAADRSDRVSGMDGRKSSPPFEVPEAAHDARDGRWRQGTLACEGGYFPFTKFGRISSQFLTQFLDHFLELIVRHLSVENSSVAINLVVRNFWTLAHQALHEIESFTPQRPGSTGLVINTERAVTQRTTK